MSEYGLPPGLGGTEDESEVNAAGSIWSSGGALDDLIADYKALAEEFACFDRPFLEDRAKVPDEMIAARPGAGKPLFAKAWAMRLRLHALVCDAKGKDEPRAKDIALLRRKVEALLISEQKLAALFSSHDKKDFRGLFHDTQVFHDLGYHCATARLNQYLAWYRRNLTFVTDIRQNGVSAVLRVRNEILHLRACLKVLLAFFDEVVIVDHGSTDGTQDYVKSLHYDKLKLFHYEGSVAQAGDFYGWQRRNLNLGSLADYYNFCFSKATGTYVCKWDADMYPLPTLGPMLDIAREGTHNVLFFNGVDCNGGTSTSFEPRLFRADKGYRYIEQENFESLEADDHNAPTSKIIHFPVYMHMKFAK